MFFLMKPNKNSLNGNILYTRSGKPQIEIKKLRWRMNKIPFSFICDEKMHIIEQNIAKWS